MDSFTISQLQRYSGISVHSIRAWEKRYDALKPERTEGNTRYYNGHQLRRLLNISSLMNSTYKISELCSFPDAKLFELITRSLEDKVVSPRDELLISQMVSAAMVFDNSLFEKVFRIAQQHYDMETTYLKILYPAMQRVGIMWSADSIAPAQEHFISALIRRKLDSGIDSLPLPQDHAPHWLLFLPEDEFHETGLLMSNYLIKKAGHQCTYLGSNVPVQSLDISVNTIKPDYLLSFLVSGHDPEADKTYIQGLIKNFPASTFFIAARAERLRDIPPSDHVHYLHSPAELKSVLHQMNKS